jgi:hypothetical protein
MAYAPPLRDLAFDLSQVAGATLRTISGWETCK